MNKFQIRNKGLVFISAVLALLPIQCLLSVYLMKREQVFMYETLTAIHDKAVSEMSTYSADSRLLTWILIGMFIADIAFLMLAANAVKKHNASVSD